MAHPGALGFPFFTVIKVGSSYSIELISINTEPFLKEFSHAEKL
jgi:hypothetical protein